MYTFLKNVTPRKLAVTEMPAFGIAMIIAETLFKFGHFVVECVAFMVTWYVISFVIDKLFYQDRAS